MQLAEPETYRFEMDDGFSLAIPCPTGSFSSASSNSSSPYEVFTPTSRRSSPNDLRLDFDGTYQSYGGAHQGELTPPSAMHKYMFVPVKAEHERMSFSSTDGSLTPTTPLRKMSDIMPYDHILDMNNITTHSMGSITPSGSLPVYTEAPLQPAPYIMTPTHSISPSEIAENASSWSCNNDSPISFFRAKVQSPQDVEPLDLHRYSQSPMGRYYLHGLPVSPNRLPTQRQAMVREARIRTTELHREIRAPRKVPEKNDNSYDVVRKAMCKCDYPNCQKAFRRNEHLKRHKQTFHGEGPNRFSCEFCGKDQFNRQDNLNNHRKLHARPNSRNRGVEYIPAAVPVIEQEERSRKRRAPPKSRLAAVGVSAAEKRGGSY
ncbi:zinc finger odd-paired-like opl [Trichoderma arundinaceum]|uniref:Zinc finger odd-paired-like opl n=1 Tax=Trichoderma arundinaceum TaxID=490622 RepID=A0A395N7J5_TRIAR|nr:zinc finger odd-paired-like opl [Trichoderma arundinaceum]